MSRDERESSYFTWDSYGDGWLDFDKTSVPAMKEFLECFVGKLIARGTTREVFECKFDKSVVIKVQRAFQTQNAVEVATWKRVEDTPSVAKWFAPVLGYSSSMRVIVQRRTMPLLKPPARIPEFLTDRKVQNYGMIGKQVVCHDYGLMDLGRIAPGNFKMEPAEWWDVGTQNDYEGR